MTKEELIEELKRCRGEGIEEGHMLADSLLLEYINDEDISKAFDALNKWYA